MLKQWYVIWGTIFAMYALNCLLPAEATIAKGCHELLAFEVSFRTVWCVYLRDVFFVSVLAPGLFKQRPPLSITASGPLLALHEEVEALLFLPEGKPYLMEVAVALNSTEVFVLKT